MLHALTILLGWVALAAGLFIPTIAPEIGNVTNIALMVFGLLLLAYAPETRAVLRQSSTWLPLAAGLVLLLALLPTARSPIHILSIVILFPLFLAGPLAALMGQLRQRLTPTAIGLFALAGAAGAALIAAFDVLVRGEARGGTLVNNPIHLADLALLVGFVALAGLFGRWRWRAVFALGPVLALVTVWFSGSRGPLLAFVPMLLAGGLTLALLMLSRRMAWVSLAAIVVVLALGGVWLMDSGVGGRLGTIGELSHVVSSGVAIDASTDERLTMYISAWNAFWASPLYGHGLWNFTTAAAQYAPEGSPYAPSGHLHNDLADFAVIGGMLGLLCYGLLIAAPLVGGWRGRQAHGGITLYLGIVASVGYLAMGLTNAMFGVLTQTIAYVTMLALIAALAHQADGDPM